MAILIVADPIVVVNRCTFGASEDSNVEFLWLGGAGQLKLS